MCTHEGYFNEISYFRQSSHKGISSYFIGYDEYIKL